jgi:hypothetical protein
MCSLAPSGPIAIASSGSQTAVHLHSSNLCGRRIRSSLGRKCRSRLPAVQYKEPQIYVLEHGYCRSLYAVDPDGMICEFTVDHPDAEKIGVSKVATAHAELKRWLAGDHRSNNTFR